VGRGRGEESRGERTMKRTGEWHVTMGWVIMVLPNHDECVNKGKEGLIFTPCASFPHPTMPR
jgi:hypothetical protein